MNTISAGFCRVDLTPEESVSLCGYGDDAQRMSVGVLDPVTGTCLAITDASGETILLYSLDLLAAYEPLTTAAREAIFNATGIPHHRIMLAGTHTHAAPGIGTMHLVRLVREGKQDILLMNWQAHAKMTSTATTAFGVTYRNHISADYIGYTRQALEEQTNMQVIFFSGAAGNLNPSSRMESEPTSEDPAIYGKQLAQAAMAALDNMRPISAGSVCSRQRMVTIPVDHSDNHLVELAAKIWAIWPEDQQLCKDTARKNGFNSAYAARDVVARSQAGTDRTLEVNTVGVGDLAFAIAPYEMFCVNGQHIKDTSPYAMTFILTCANAYNNYLPSDFAFTHGGYEVDSRRLPRGSAEMMADTFLEMLREQKEA